MTKNKTAQLALIEPPKEPANEALKSWALVEIFGHQKIVGWMTVDPPEFPGMIRVDVPDLLKDGKVERQGFTRYLGRAALYGVTTKRLNGQFRRNQSRFPEDFAFQLTAEEATSLRSQSATLEIPTPLTSAGT